MASLCHPWVTTTNLCYRFPIFETSATALVFNHGYDSMCFFPNLWAKHKEPCDFLQLHGGIVESRLGQVVVHILLLGRSWKDWTRVKKKQTASWIQQTGVNRCLVDYYVFFGWGRGVHTWQDNKTVRLLFFFVGYWMVLAYQPGNQSQYVMSTLD